MPPLVGWLSSQDTIASMDVCRLHKLGPRKARTRDTSTKGATCTTGLSAFAVELSICRIHHIMSPQFLSRSWRRTVGCGLVTARDKAFHHRTYQIKRDAQCPSGGDCRQHV